LLAAFAVGADLFGVDATLQLTRVMGSSLARIADAAVSGFLLNVEGPLVEEHSRPAELARASFEATEILQSLPDVFAPIFLHHAALATMRTRMTRDAALTYADFRLSVCFLDLVDYTAWSRGLSTADLARAVNDFEEKANDLIIEHGAHIVKNIGDAVMFVAVDAATACDVALSLCEYVGRHRSLTQLRGAIASGSVLSRDGDYFGPTVNLAARAVKIAEPGQVVADAPIEGYTAEPVGARELRGFDEPVELFVISC
jgi:adenylate cyclase